MGLNVNYNLLMEGNNSVSTIPEYRSYYKPAFLAESEIMTCIAEFNQEMRESSQFLTNLYEAEYVDESTAAVNIVNGIKFVAEKVRKAITKVMGIIIDAFKKAIEAIQKMIAEKKASKVEKLRMNERISILKKELANQEVTVAVASIDPTKDLLNKSFPDTSIIGSDLVKMATDTMNNYCTNIVQKDGADGSLLYDTEVKASDSFVTFIEGEKNKILRQIFGRYDYDELAISKSAGEVAEKAFGSNEKIDTKLSTDLYLTACDNLEQNALNGIVTDMKNKINEVEKNYKAIAREMDTIYDSVKHFDKLTSNANGIDMKERYHNAVKIITNRINRTMNVIQQVINADMMLVTKKAARIYAIYGVAGDSAKIKSKCDSIILKSVITKASDKVGYNITSVNAKDIVTASEAAKYEEYAERLGLDEASKVSRKKVIDDVVKALSDEGLKAHISKNSEWGEKNFLSGKSNTLCLGSFSKETWDQAYKIVKKAIPSGFSASQDNYFTVFINAPKMVSEDYDIVNGREEVEDIFQIQESFDNALVMVEEAFHEEAYTEAVMTAILEAEGDQQRTQTNTQTTTNNNPQSTENVTQKTNIVKQAGATIVEFVKNIIANLGEAMQRFRNRIDELIIKNPANQKYWADNKDGISKTTFVDTTVNEWYSYKIPYFKNSTFIKFDVDSPDMKSDEALQEAIMKKITGGNSQLPQFDEKDSFSQKINKIYQGEFTKVENSDGKKLAEIKYNHQEAFEYVNDVITKGFASEAFNKMTDDYKNIDADAKNTQKNYQTYADKLKSTTSTTNLDNNEQKAANTNTAPQNAAAMVEDDFRFNLAEHFGLVHREATITVGQADAASANANGAGGSESGDNKELDAMIKRCFQFNTIAVTARMTAALAAYKQYMTLFKTVYKKGKTAPKQEENNAEQKPTEEKK